MATTSMDYEAANGDRYEGLFAYLLTLSHHYYQRRVPFAALFILAIVPRCRPVLTLFD